MRCEGCERGEHFLCGRQSWCDCECEGTVEPGDDIGPDFPEAVTANLVDRFRAAVRERVVEPLLKRRISSLFRRDSAS